MSEIISDNFCIKKENILPKKILKEKGIENSVAILEDKDKCVSFNSNNCLKFCEINSWILLDFGKEICGSLRIITSNIMDDKNATVKLTFGESVTEAMSNVENSSATNDHSPREILCNISMMSDLIFGQTGFRFVKIELTEDKIVTIQGIYAQNNLPVFKNEGKIKTSDKKLNKIIDTSIYTLKLNFQNGYIWDGIKRDRLIWCGDLHQEILNSMYLFGDNDNIKNSLEFLREDTQKGKWINGIPTYSAWWVINLCDYCSYFANNDFFEKNRWFALDILENINKKIEKDGTMKLEEGLAYFLDWPTKDSSDAKIGTASLFIYMAHKFLKIEKNKDCEEIITKLKKYLSMSTDYKQIKAFQILAGRNEKDDFEFLEKDGAKGFSTFMAYYILSANAMSKGTKSVDIIKEYFGAMLSRGATTFWEDFDMEWLENSGSIDKFPKKGQKDIHGDFGNHCYKGFRHSLCHGWASGVVSFIIESVFGIEIKNGCSEVVVKPNCKDLDFNIKLPLKKGWLRINYRNGELTIKAPKDVKINI